MLTCRAWKLFLVSGEHDFHCLVLIAIELRLRLNEPKSCAICSNTPKYNIYFFLGRRKYRSNYTRKGSLSFLKRISSIRFHLFSSNKLSLRAIALIDLIEWILKRRYKYAWFVLQEFIWWWNHPILFGTEWFGLHVNVHLYWRTGWNKDVIMLHVAIIQQYMCDEHEEQLHS